MRIYRIDIPILMRLSLTISRRYTMNPVQAIIAKRQQAAAIRLARIEIATNITVGNILIDLANAVDYQIHVSHFMDSFPQKYADVPDVRWNEVIAKEISSITDGITLLYVDGVYTLSSSAEVLSITNLDKYFNVE